MVIWFLKLAKKKEKGNQERKKADIGYTSYKL